MAKTHGKNGSVQISDVAVAEVRDWSLDGEANVADAAAMGDDYVSHETGQISQSGSITCWWDATDTSGQEAMGEGDTVALKLFPGVDEASAVYYGGNAKITKVGKSVSHDSYIEQTFEYVNADGDGIIKGSVGA